VSLGELLASALQQRSERYVAEFLQRAPELYLDARADPPEGDIRARVSALAVEVLGPEGGFSGGARIE